MVAIGAVAKAELLGREVMIVAAIILAQRHSQFDHVTCSGHLPAVGQAGRITEGGARHAKAARLGSHHLGKLDFRATKMFGDNNCNVVGRFGDQRQNSILDGNGFARLKTKFGGGLAPGTLGNLHPSRKRYLAVFQGIKDHVKGHDLG